MKYSPKLKQAAEEIKAILRKHDIAGAIALHTPGYAEHLFEITPSYSAVLWNPQHDGITIKGKLIHYNGNRKEQMQKLADTANMFKHLTTVTARNLEMAMAASDMVDTTYNAEHGEGGFSSHNEQNN